jgi:hypothetical protein
MAATTWGNIVTFDFVPPSISSRQFFQVLANRDLITKQEALDAVTFGALPAAIDNLINLIPDEDIAWQARMAFAGARDFERSNWFVEFFGAMQNMTSTDIDQLWRDGAAIK